MGRKKKRKKWWLPKGELTVTSLIAKGHEPCCACCGAVEPLSFDHVKPKSKGGEDSTENGQILCYNCNSLKADRIITLDKLYEERMDEMSGKTYDFTEDEIKKAYMDEGVWHQVRRSVSRDGWCRKYGDLYPDIEKVRRKDKPNWWKPESLKK